MPEVVPLAVMPGGKRNVFAVTVEPGFMLWLHYHSKTKITIGYKHQSGGLPSFYVSTPPQSQYRKLKRFRRCSEGNPMEVIKPMIV